MKRYLVFILVNLNLFCFGQSNSSSVDANNTFAFELLKEIFDNNSNCFSSPYSISSALAMTYGGARNETKNQMAAVLHFDTAQLRTHEGFSGINSSLVRLKNDSTLKLSVANALWRDKNTRLNPEYLSLAKKYYNASIYPITTAKAINDWAEKETNNKIKNLVTDEIIEDARLILTNAIYFKDDWKTKFDPAATRKDVFYSPGKSVNADMMFLNTKVNYFEDEDNQVIELPYRGPLSMIVILPKKSISGLVNSVDYKYCKKITDNFGMQEVTIYLPKFTSESSFNLSTTLKNMGMADAFSEEGADFSGMGDSLFIGEVVHKSFIEVNEKGSEAAAATAVIMVTMSLHEELIFNANKPFLYFIRDNNTKTILFIGTLMNPVSGN